MSNRISLNLDEIEESKPVGGGKYDLLITSADSTTTKAGDPMLKIVMAIEDAPNAPSVTHFITLPNGGDKDEFKGLMLKRFLVAFSIPHDSSGFDVDDFINSKAHAELSLSEPDANGNVYNRLQLPRLPSEQGVAGKLSVAKPPKRA